MKYHVAITDNETGKILVDVDCSALLGAARVENDNVTKMSFADCTVLDLFAVINAASDVLKESRNEIKLLING
jgi:hypothetical protein